MDGKNEVAPIAVIDPERRPRLVAPKLCAASSITGRPWRAAMALIAFMSAHWPYRLTGMMARVRGVIAASTNDASISAVSGSMSTKTGFAPASTMTSAVAAKLKGVVITSSPGRISSAISAISSASVPLETVMQCRAPVRCASAASSSATSGPMMYWPWSSTACMRASMLGLSALYWLFRSMKSMLNPVAGHKGPR